MPNTDKVRDFKNDFVPKYNNFFTGTVAGKWLPLEQVITDLTKQFFASGMAKKPEKKLSKVVVGLMLRADTKSFGTLKMHQTT